METKIIRSHIGLTVLATLIWGILWGCIIDIAIYVFYFFTDLRIFSFLYWVLEWPKALIPGFIIGFVYIMCRRTAVTVSKSQVQIKRGFRTWVFPIETFSDVFTTKNFVGHNLFFAYFVKRYLVFDDGGKETQCRVYDMTEDQTETIVQYIREQQLLDLPIEDKIAIQETLEEEDGYNEFFIDPIEIYHDEKQYLYKISLIVLVAGFVLLVLALLDSSTPMFEIIPNEILATIAIIYAMTAPLKAMYLKRKSKQCPRHIRVGSDAIWINDTRYTYSSLTRLRLTSPRKRTLGNDKFNYYFWIENNGEKKKYWLGSEVSFGGYEQLCDCLEQAFFAYPEKITYKK